MSIPEKPKFILVIGHEGSGNHLAADTLAIATGFDYDDGETHLDKFGLIKTTYLLQPVQQWWDDPLKIVCDHSRIARRSIPHGKSDDAPLRFLDHPLKGRHFPDPIPLIQGLEAAGYDVYVVLTVRDRTVAELSNISERVCCKPEAAKHEMDQSIEILQRTLASHKRCFVCSYESLMMLGQPYVQFMYRFAGVDSDYMPVLKNDNPKYIGSGQAACFSILTQPGMQIGVMTRKDDFIWGGDLRALNAVIEGMRTQGVNIKTAKTVEELTDCRFVFISNTCDDRRPEMKVLQDAGIPYGLIGFHEDFAGYYPLSMGFAEYVGRILTKEEENGVIHQIEDLWENPDIVKMYNHCPPMNIQLNLPVLSNARFCLAASATEERTLRRDCPAAKVETVYWDIPLFRDTDEGDDDFLKLAGLTPGNYILQVGRLETRKNQLATILATKDMDVPLVFIATRGYQQWYELLAVNAAAKYRKAPTYFICEEHPTQHVGNAASIIQMPGGQKIPESWLVAAYKHCGLYMHPAFYEAPGYTYLEAAHIGKSVVASSWGCLRDYCTFHGGDATMEGRFTYVLPYHLPALEKAAREQFGKPFAPHYPHPIFKRTTEDVGREVCACLERYF